MKTYLIDSQYFFKYEEELRLRFYLYVAQDGGT